MNSHHRDWKDISLVRFSAEEILFMEEEANRRQQEFQDFIKRRRIGFQKRIDAGERFLAPPPVDREEMERKSRINLENFVRIALRNLQQKEGVVDEPPQQVGGGVKEKDRKRMVQGLERCLRDHRLLSHEEQKEPPPTLLSHEEHNEQKEPPPTVVVGGGRSVLDAAFLGISPSYTTITRYGDGGGGGGGGGAAVGKGKFRFTWAAAPDTGSAIKILSIDEMSSKLGITEIRGEFVCSKCHQTGTIGFDLKTKSREIAMFIGFYKGVLKEDGLQPNHGILHPKLPSCPNCCSFNLEPVIIPAAAAAENNNNESDYQKINWLFLFLGQMLGCCTVEQLDFFCKHSSSASDYRTGGGTKGRLLYLTCITVCKQLYPTIPFDP